VPVYLYLGSKFSFLIGHQLSRSPPFLFDLIYRNFVFLLSDFSVMSKVGHTMLDYIRCL
jgi:hypothetical protein